MITINLKVHGKNHSEYITINDIKKFYSDYLPNYSWGEPLENPPQRAGVPITNITDVFKFPLKGETINGEIITNVEVTLKHAIYDNACGYLEINIYTNPLPL